MRSRGRRRHSCRRCHARCGRWPRKDFDQVENLRLHEFLPLLLIKHNIPGYNNFFSRGDPNPPLIRASVPNQLSHFCMAIKLHTLFLRYMNKSIATKDAEMGKIRFLPMPCLEGRLVVKSRGRRAVLEVYHCCRDLRPKVLWKLTICNNRLDPFHDCTICSFCDAVLIGMVCCRQLMLDPLLFEEFVQVPFVLRTIIGSDAFDLRPKLGVD